MQNPKEEKCCEKCNGMAPTGLTTFVHNNACSCHSPMSVEEELIEEFQERFKFAPTRQNHETGKSEHQSTWLRRAFARIRSDERKKDDKYIAYCECGDALERTEMYPVRASYHCFGCDRTYKLTTT